MRLVVAFMSGVLVCGLLIIGGKSVLVLPTQADEASDNATENVTMTLVNLIPNVEEIYEESLTLPFTRAESKIYDPDIAEFYSELLDRTGLR